MLVECSFKLVLEFFKMVIPLSGEEHHGVTCNAPSGFKFPNTSLASVEAFIRNYSS